MWKFLHICFFFAKETRMTELEALNMLLRLIGNSPVNDIDSNLPDAANARTTLDRIRRQAQRRGWWFNIDYDKTYQPNDKNEIVIAKEVISVVAHNRNYIQRGNKLYNKEGNTFKFSSGVSIYREVRTLEWDDMPDCMQSYCGYMAGSQFIRDELEDNSKSRELKEDAGLAMLDVKKQDLEEGQYNVFGNARVARARAGVRPYNRGSIGRFYGDPSA